MDYYENNDSGYTAKGVITVFGTAILLVSIVWLAMWIAVKYFS